MRLAGVASLGAAAFTVAIAGLISALVAHALSGEAWPLRWLEQSHFIAPADSASWPTVLAGLLVAAVLMRVLLQAVRDWAGIRLAVSIRLAVRGELVERLTAAGPLRVTRQGQPGAWATRYQQQVEALGGYYARHLPALFAAIAVPLLLLATIAAVDWLAALLLLLSAPMIPFFMALIGMGSAKVHAEQQLEQQRLGGHFLDRLRALDLLRRNLALERARDEVAIVATGFRDLTMRVLRVAFLSSAVIEFFSAVAIGLVAIYIGFGLLGWITFGPAEAMSLEAGLFILLLAPEFFAPLRSLASSYHDRAAAQASASEIAPLLAAVLDEGGETRVRPSGRELFRLDSVGVRHAPDRPAALTGIDLRIRTGERLGLSGESGSGKSTLLGLLAGFTSPTTGQMARHEQANGFAWIAQRTHLFHGSLRDNLRMSRQGGVSDDEMRAALALAGLPETDPHLPQGLDTPIGEHNRGLSGGQSQRVALARALLSGHALWLLDEPTSAVDAATAEVLAERIFALAERHAATLVIASHDPRLLNRCDRVLALQAGRLEGGALAEGMA